MLHLRKYKQVACDFQVIVYPENEKDTKWPEMMSILRGTKLNERKQQELSNYTQYHPVTVIITRLFMTAVGRVYAMS